MMSHQFKSSILRAYDIRGVVGEDMDATDAYWVGRGFGYILCQKGGKKVAVARDGRLTSQELSHHLIKGLMDSGCEVSFVGLCPSPMLYFAEYHLDTDAAIMVTGSHNPPEYNGFKMSLGRKSFYGDDILEMAKYVREGGLPKQEGSVSEVDISEDYIKRILKGFPLDCSLKVVWDPGNGAGADIISRLVKVLPGTHHVINGEIDGNFPAHHPDPTVAANLKQLQDAVAEYEADIGLAFDGDADRIGAVDGHGRIFWGDQLLLLLGQDVLSRHPGATIIADVKASSAFFEGIEAAGGEPLMWMSGHSHIKTKMKLTGAQLAGEMSGHIFIADDFYGFDDGIYSGLRLLKMIFSSGKTPVEAYDSLPETFVTEEIRIPCNAERKFEVPDELGNALREEKVSFCCIDGVRADLPQGWWLLRASNTQDEVVIRCEGSSPTNLNTVIDHLVGRMERCQFDPCSLKRVRSQKIQ